MRPERTTYIKNYGEQGDILMSGRGTREPCEVFLGTPENIVARLGNVELLDGSLRVTMKDDASEVDLAWLEVIGK